MALGLFPVKKTPLFRAGTRVESVIWYYRLSKNVLWTMPRSWPFWQMQACHCFFWRSSCSTKLEDVEYPCSSCIWRRGGGIVWIFWDCSVWKLQVEDSPYDPEQMVCMNYGEYANQKVRSLEAEYPTFLYAMPMTKTRVFFEVLLSCFFLSFCFNHYHWKICCSSAGIPCRRHA